MRRAGAVMVLAGGVAVLVAAIPRWFTAPLAGISEESVSVSGFAAAPSLGPLLLVVAAALVARTLARGAMARALGILGVAAGVAVIAVTATALAGRGRSALEAAAASLTGVEDLAGEIVTTAWPGVTAGAGVILAAGLLLLALAPQRASGSRYERSGGQAAALRGPVSDWDSLTRGEDPTTGDAGDPELTDPGGSVR